MERFEQDMVIKRKVKSRTYHIDLQTDQAPSFTHFEIEELYNHGLDIPEEVIQNILNLPRETLITDLERVLEDAICRYEYFYNETAKEYDVWNEDRLNFSVHAILLLTELRSKQSLDKILNLLRQGDEFWEFWYSDLLEDIFSESVATLAEYNIEAITNFVKEPDLDTYSRNVGVSALEMVAMFHGERRNEVINHFDDLIQFHLSQLDNDRIIDTALLSFLVWSCMNISASELLPSIKELYMHNLIEKSIVGDFKRVEKVINDEMAGKRDQPKTIYERYDFLDDSVFIDGFTPPKNLTDNKGSLHPFSEFREDDPADTSSPSLFNSKLKTATNPYKDTGRNDPCPCGSGKKYKKCCL
ncbi:MAG: DUF1186 domain-containing protein [Balneolaceae bacterium]|nr:DUF1186 domain-containing protein [Balneolaceae bacterium]